MSFDSSSVGWRVGRLPFADWVVPVAEEDMVGFLGAG